MLIIPFLLGVELISPQPDGGSYGVESTFRCRAGVTVTRFGRQQMENITFPIKCRLKNETTICCSVTEASFETANSNAEETNIFEAMKIPFELHFDTSGIRTITVLGEAPLYVMKGVRRVAGLMSVGTYTDKRPLSEVFLVTERELPNGCDIYTEVVEQRARELTDESIEESMSHDAKPRNYRLTSPLFTGNDTQEIKIKRLMNADNCGRDKQFFKFVTPYGVLNITSYGNDVQVTREGTFSSAGHLQAKQTFDLGVEISINIDMYISIELESVEPATDPLPDVSTDYTTTLTIDYGNLDDRSNEITE